MNDNGLRPGEPGLPPDPAPDSTRSLAEVAYRRIEELIVTLELEPGMVISETALTERLKIGRTPVREALQRLSSEGLVVVMPRRGVVVSEINLGRHIDLLETRREVERLVCRKAAIRSTDQERVRFRELAEDFGSVAGTQSDIAFMRYDREFNAALLSSCRNEYAAHALELMQGLSRRFWYRHYQRVMDLGECSLLHRQVALAIADGDPDAAARASDDLLDYIEAFARSTI